MKIITGLDYQLKNTGVSLGKFDGIHRGHRYLLSEVIRQKACIPTVFTFESSRAVSKIYTQEEKNWILENLGIRREVIFPFNDKTKRMSPEEFVDGILIKRMDVKHICVGEDFRFGRDRGGDVQLLEQLKEKYGYSLTIVPKLTDGEEIISSTLIRGLMERGELSRANELLGAPYFVMGKVLHGNALGRTMGMPTANLIPAEDKKLLPYGVYATTVRIGKKYYKGVTNIGKKPTIGEYAAGVETYIEDFREDIYGETIQVFFHQFIRKEQRFEDVGQLRRQIERDRETAFRERSNIDIPNAISYNDILD